MDAFAANRVFRGAGVSPVLFRYVVAVRNRRRDAGATKSCGKLFFRHMVAL
jgi:hypothetical protein